MRKKRVASEIVERIEKGEWTATRVLEAYIARAAIAHEKTNCLTEGTHIPLGSFFILFYLWWVL